MNVEIGAEAPLFPEKEYINGIAVAVRDIFIITKVHWSMFLLKMCCSMYCTVHYGDPIAGFQSAPLLSGQESSTVKKVIDFSVPIARMPLNQTFAGRE